MPSLAIMLIIFIRRYEDIHDGGGVVLSWLKAKDHHELAQVPRRGYHRGYKAALEIV
jgi:hypothetical protein